MYPTKQQNVANDTEIKLKSDIETSISLKPRKNYETAFSWQHL